MLEAEIEELTVLTIARRQPVAVDLRELIGPSASPATSNESVIWPRISRNAR